MSDFSSARPTNRAYLTDGKWRKVVMEGKIHLDYRKKVFIKTLIRVPLYSLFYFFIVLQFGFYLFFSEDFFVALFFMILGYFIFVGMVLVIVGLITWFFYKSYVKRFFFEITDSNIVINHGVFRQSRETIPYTRVQNISITIYHDFILQYFH